MPATSSGDRGVPPARDRAHVALDESNRQVNGQRLQIALIDIVNMDSNRRRIDQLSEDVRDLEVAQTTKFDSVRRQRIEEAIRFGRVSISRLNWANRANFAFYLEQVQAMADLPQADLADATRAADDLMSRDPGDGELARARDLLMAHIDQARGHRAAMPPAMLDGWRQQIETGLHQR